MAPASAVHLFIDTNVLLTFYAFAKDDLAQLEKLVDLLSAASLKLYLTGQVIDEFRRNRESSLAASLAAFKHPNVGCPSFMLPLGEYQAYSDAVASLRTAHSRLVAAATNDSKLGTLPADRLFNKLLHKAKVIEITPEVIALADRRNRLGNPPGKGKSIGDELNWELLLEHVTGEDLHIITKDGDYLSPLGVESPKDFLAHEWNQRKKGKLFVYEQLGSFISMHYPEKKFLLELEKSEAITKFTDSVAFSSTHAAVSLLTPYVPFLIPDEIDQILVAARHNPQIYAILGDYDVSTLLSFIAREHSITLPKELRYKMST